MGAQQALKEVFSGDAEIVNLLFTQQPSKSDCIVVWTGYGTALADYAMRLFQQGLGKEIAIFGSNSYPWKENPSADAKVYGLYTRTHGFSNQLYIDASVERTGATNLQAETTLWFLRSKGFKKALLVTAGYHHPRAYATLVRAIERSSSEVQILPAPFVRENWASIDSVLGTSWLAALLEESKKIATYRAKGDVATWDEVCAYLQRVAKSTE